MISDDMHCLRTGSSIVYMLFVEYFMDGKPNSLEIWKKKIRDQPHPLFSIMWRNPRCRGAAAQNAKTELVKFNRTVYYQVFMYHFFVA